MSTQVTIVKTGIANLASVRAGLERVGASVSISDKADKVADAAHIVLPGVGSFGPGMKILRENGLDVVLKERISSGRSTLCICLGLQLLFEASEESPGEQGLGVIPGEVRHFAAGLRVPHFGWNLVKPDSKCRILQEGYAYFANSYRATEMPEGWNVARTDHGGEFISAFERGAVVAGQFHPELSGQWGLEFLQRWLEVGDGAGC